ncbi:MAG: DUF3999 family protein [Propionivibrio sp.]|nr:DUF3999 family protein [Propionivibrio sp.]
MIRPQNAAATARPELGLSWQPMTLVFLAGGTPPYTLNFGRSEATPASQALSQVAPGFTPGELNQLERAQAGELRTGPANVSADSAASQAGLPARQRTFNLWGVLLLGVVILGGMAWRLLAEHFIKGLKSKLSCPLKNQNSMGDPFHESFRGLARASA